MQASPLLSLSPRFDAYSSRRITDIAARVVEELRVESASNDDFLRCDTEESPPPQKTSDAKPEEEEEQQELPRIEEDDDDFEFSFVCQDPETALISAEEIFYNGWIRPLYHIFNRHDAENDGVSKPYPTHRLPMRKPVTEERHPASSCMSSKGDCELDGLPSGSYCLWTPKAGRRFNQSAQASLSISMLSFSRLKMGWIRVC
ncbi:hypothetical protein L1049_028272 [Liquidambar formosana]|uniref:Uncharacterized protein n=1 Tax=Liquidambar formosana TaxID=63359 RepID=A0AAP0RK52_LIQFO